MGNRNTIRNIGLDAHVNAGKDFSETEGMLDVSNAKVILSHALASEWTAIIFPVPTAFKT